VKTRLYIADDHAVLRDGLRLMFESYHCFEVVGEAANGRDAVEGAVHLRPDVMLMDIAMPWMNGIEATRLIKKKQLVAKVIMLSMHSTTEHIVQALDAGADGFVLKETAGAEVIDAVGAVLKGQFYWSRKIPEKTILACRTRKSNTDAPTPVMSLSRREREVVQLVAEGLTSAQIARLLGISPKSVETYRSRLMTKLGVTDVPGLVKFAIQHGFTSLT